MAKIINIVIWSVIGIFSFQYFTSPIHKINNSHKCDFNVFFTNWDNELINIEKLKKEEEEYFVWAQSWDEKYIVDAKKDIEKEKYIPEEYVEKAKDTLKFHSDLKAVNEVEHNKKLNNLEICKTFIGANK